MIKIQLRYAITKSGDLNYPLLRACDIVQLLGYDVRRCGIGYYTQDDSGLTFIDNAKVAYEIREYYIDQDSA